MSRRGAGVTFCIFGTLISPGLVQFHGLSFGSGGLPLGALFLLAGVIYLVRAEAAEKRTGE